MKFYCPMFRRRSWKTILLGILMGCWGLGQVFAKAAQDCDVVETATPQYLVVPVSPSQLGGLRLMDSPTSGPPLRPPDMVWVEDMMSSLTMDEKIGQMIITSQHSTGESLIDQYKVGGFIFLGNGQNASDIAATVNRLQTYSRLPLWFSIDAEAGLGARVADATIFPLLMAFGAVDDPSLNEACGRITARECRAVGVQIAYGPVVDVNTEPINPVISTRSLSDNPDRVTRLARGFLQGARAEGILCTFKHYPGHGASTGDSHSSLPTIDIPLSTLEAIHLKPYREMVKNGDVDFVMTAHVWYPQVDMTKQPWPATLSHIFLNDILRTELGYNGVVISDSYGMQGLAIAVPDEQERAVVGVEAGLDIVLNPPSVGQAFLGIQGAVQSGRLTESRINDSVRRILIAKSRVGLPENRTVDPALYPTVLRHPEHLATVRTVCEKAFTKCKYTLPSEPPILSTHHVLVLNLTSQKTIFYLMSSSYFTTPFKQAVPNTDIVNVKATVSSTTHDSIIASAPDYDRIVVLGYDWYKILSNTQIGLINDLCSLNVPVIYVGFGAPYHYTQIPNVDAFYCGYSSVDAMQAVAVEALLGTRQPQGRLPVVVPGLFPMNASGWMAR